MLAVAEMSKDEEGRNSDLLSTSPFSPSISASLSSLYQCIAAPPSFCEALLDISYCHLLLASIHLDPVSYSCRCYCYSYNNYYIITFKIRNFIFYQFLYVIFDDPFSCILFSSPTPAKCFATQN
jgi:hypothetical protein